MRAVALAGLIDTGAVRSAITRAMAELIGLATIGTTRIASPLASGIVAEYDATLEFWNPGFDQSNAKTFRITIPQLGAPMAGATLLIGMDILRHGTLTVGADARWNLTF